jgi:hypothetical protein
MRLRQTDGDFWKECGIHRESEDAEHLKHLWSRSKAISWIQGLLLATLYESSLCRTMGTKRPSSL